MQKVEERGKLRKEEATETKLGKTGIREGGPRGSSKEDGGNTYGRRWRGRNTESKEEEGMYREWWKEGKEYRGGSWETRRETGEI